MLRTGISTLSLILALPTGAQELTYELSAVVQTGADRSVAYIVDRSTGTLVSIKVGESLGDWTVESISDRQVRLVRDGQSALIGYSKKAVHGRAEPESRSANAPAQSISPERAKEVDELMEQIAADHDADQKRLRRLYFDARDSAVILTLLKSGWPGPESERERLRALYASDPQDAEIVWLIENGWDPTRIPQ